MPYPAAIGQRPLEVREAYAALEQYAADYGRDALLLLMHASVPETLRADLLDLIRVNFLPDRRADLSLDADVLFSPLATGLGGGYYRLDAQLRWHGLALLRSLYRDDARPRARRVAELLWRYVQAMERRASRAADPQFAEFLDIQRWVALAYLEPANAAHAFADALRQAGEAPASALLRLGGLTSAIEMPLANEQELLAYAKAMDALVSGDDERARTLVQALGDNEIRVGNVVLKAPKTLFARRQQEDVPKGGDESSAKVRRRKVCLVLIGAGKKALPDGRALDLDQAFAMIRKAVTGLDMDCLRLDDVRTADASGRAIYERLLDADLVVCDLSRYDDALAYLLGVRWALRPSGTLLVAERTYTGSVANLTRRLLRYHAQDDGIGSDERARFVERLQAIVSEPNNDNLRSDVYADGSLSPPQRVEPGGPTVASATSEAWHQEGSRGRCLVLQTFGKHSGWRSGRTRALDESYRIIREAVDSVGLECVRFETLGLGSFDGSMFDLLHEAELVIADVSSKVEDVLLALGIRFGLCPTRTLLVAAQGSVPAQLAALRVLHYRPMDMSPGIENADGFRSELVHSITQALTTRAVDSPVYLALPSLQPPRRLPDPARAEGAVAVSEAAVDAPAKPPWASAAGNDEYGRYAEITIDGVRQRFRWIEPGSFEMGSPASEPGHGSDEVQHTVTLSRGFWLADTACSQAFWQAVTGSNPSNFKEDPRNPVQNVSWNDAQSFVAELNRRLPGLQARLPSEAEWEYACRAGTTTPISFGVDITPDQVNFVGRHPYAGGETEQYRERTVAVGLLPPNAWGLYEMHGNVWEWCADWYGKYATGAQLDPRGPQTGVYRVLRGGSWFDYGGIVRSAYRNGLEPGLRFDDFGFRLALGQAGPAEPV